MSAQNAHMSNLSSDARSSRPTVRDLFDLTGSVAVVTGGSRGIGRAIIQTFAESGADVVIASRKREVCERVAQEVHDMTGRQALAVACHVGRWDDCERLIENTLERFGRIDIFVNNAGMSPSYSELATVTEELYDKTLGVNLKGPFRLAVLAGTYMAQHDGGSIINIGTVASLAASPTQLPYACAKAGLNVLTIGLAEAFAPKVRVNAILPGAFRTDISKAWTEREREGAYVPMKRLGEPDEIAPLALYLASPAASYTTGTIVRVDGGVSRKV